MWGSIEMLPSSVLQEILSGRLGAVDLAPVEASSSLFRAPCGIEPCESKPITEAAAHHSCQVHPVFENFPSRSRLELLARYNGNWKQMLHFLECLQRCSGRSADAGNVVAMAGAHHTLIVNGKGELYINAREIIYAAPVGVGKMAIVAGIRRTESSLPHIQK